MKLTRKIEGLGKGLKMPETEKDGGSEEIAPSLFIHQLPSALEGIPEKGDFQAHIKGKVRRHSVTTEGGKTHHSYDLDVHHLEPHGNGKEEKKKKSTREGVDEAFEKYGPKEAPPPPPKGGKEPPPKLPPPKGKK